MRLLAVATAALGLLIGFGAAAQNVPTDGFYVAANAPGMGWNIESQNGVVAVTHYVYDDEGYSTFYTSAGVLSGGLVTSDLFAYDDGSCVGCSRKQPTSLNLGQVRVQFLDNETARITYPNGATYTVQRLFFGYGVLRHQRLPGIWHLTKGALGVYFGDVLHVTGLCGSPCDNKPDWYAGRVLDGSSSRILIVAPLEDDPNTMFMLVDASTSYYNAYMFQLQGDGWNGRSWAYLKDSQLSGDGLDMFASRIAGPTGIGDKRAVAPFADLDALNAMVSALSSDKATKDRVSVSGSRSVSTASIQAMAERLDQSLRHLKTN